MLNGVQQEMLQELTADQVTQLREKAQTDLFFLAKGILGYTQVDAGAHAALCQFMTNEKKNRRMVLMPRGHLKCWRKSFVMPLLNRPAFEYASSGKIVQSSYVIEGIGARAECVGVRTEYGRYLEVTHNHPVYTWDGWKNASDLVVDEWIATPRSLPFGEYHNPALAALFGFMLGDGDCVRMRYFNNSAIRRAVVLALVKQLGGYTYESTPVDRVAIVSVNGLNNLFREHGVFGHRAADKQAPDCVLNGDEATVRAFLYGLFESDGTILSGRQGTTYCTISERLARDVQHLLLRFGIRARLYTVTLNTALVQNYLVYHVHFTDFAGVWHKQEGQQFQHDNFPPQWRKLIPKGWKLKLRDAGVRIDNKYATSRDKIARTAAVTHSPELAALVQSDLCWEQVTEVKSLGEDEIISIESGKFHTLLIGDVLTHNTSLCTIADSIRLSLRNPNVRILIMNEVFDNAAIMLNELKGHWESGAMLKLLFPELVPTRFAGAGANWSKDAASINRTTNVRESTWTASGSGGSPQSQHFNFIKNDDLIGEKAKESETEMQKAIRWVDSMVPLLDRLEDTIDFYGTRKTLTDVYDHAERKFGKRLARFVRYPIENGVPIFPKMSMEELTNIMVDTPEVWAHDFMNNPVGKGGLDWGQGLLRHYAETTDGGVYFEHHITGELSKWLPRELDTVITVDPNGGKLHSPDKNAVVVSSCSPDDQIFVRETWCDRAQPEDLISVVFDLAMKYRPRVIGFEDAGQQNTMYYFEKRMQKEGIYFRLIPLKHQNRIKEQRIRSALDTPLKARRLYVLPSMITLITAIQLFPQLAAHNWDEIDALSYGPEVYAPGMRLADLAAAEEAETKVLQMRGLTGYGDSCTRRRVS